jgi:hypothetical protein
MCICGATRPNFDHYRHRRIRQIWSVLWPESLDLRTLTLCDGRSARPHWPPHMRFPQIRDLVIADFCSSPVNDDRHADVILQGLQSRMVSP